MITAIIGHGKSVEGRGWGAFIDSCDVVVRMWDHHWQDPADFGAKYDFGFYELHHKQTKRFIENNQRQPARGWVASDIRRVANYTVPILPNSEVVDFRRITRAHRQSIGGVGTTGRWELTRGGCATCWAISKSKRGDTVMLFGCDNLRAGIALPISEAFSETYIADQAKQYPIHGHYTENATRYGNHDFPSEGRLLKHLADRVRVKLAFAQDELQ